MLSDFKNDFGKPLVKKKKKKKTQVSVKMRCLSMMNIHKIQTN